MLNSLLAFFAAPFIALLVTSPVFAACIGQLSLWGLYFGFGLFFAYTSTVLFAVPMYLLVRLFVGPARLWHCMLGGLVSAVPICLLEFNPFSSSRSAQQSLAYIAFTVMTGVVSGIAFWQVLRVLDAERLRKAELKNVP